MVKAVACGAAIRGFESPRSPSKIWNQDYLTCNFELRNPYKIFCNVLTKTIKEEKNTTKDSFIGSYWITTFGCQMNKADSERMAGTLEKMGYSKAVDELKADLVLYNTCTIRDSAQQKVYSFLGRQIKRKHSLPKLKLVVAGCLAQQEGESLLRRVPELDLIMGPQHVNNLENLLERVQVIMDKQYLYSRGLLCK